MKANHVHEVIDIGWIIAVSQHDGWSGTVFYINVGVSILLSVRARFRQTRSKARMNTRRNLLVSHSAAPVIAFGPRPHNSASPAESPTGR